MLWLSCCVGLVGVASQVAAGPVSSRSAKPTYQSHPDRVNAVKDAFRRSWDGYYKYAFPHDSLRPVSKTFTDDRNGWGASAIDAFSTALVMQDVEVIQQILDYVPTINFDKAVGDISLFETTIRYLGGLLSAYDLLNGPLKQYANDTSKVKKVLDQAEHLASNLKVAFDTPTGIPDNDVNFSPPRRNGSTTNSIATIGTLVLEWTRLADLTDKPLYGQLAQKGESYLLDPKPAAAQPFPGLVGTNVNISNGLFVDSQGGWVGGDDSFYEYLIKTYVYDPKRFAVYKDRWVAAADSTIQHLASHPSSRPDLTFLAMYNNQTLLFVSQHLACFAGGNFILGGLTLNEQKYIDFGLQLAAGCHDTYNATATGIGPEQFRWQDGSAAQAGRSTNPAPPANQSAFYQEAGFWFDDAEYVLRPEVIETYYYAYRATGDAKYQEWAWDAFLAINATCWAGNGYSSVTNVNAAGGGSFEDFQESFWFAEVLKYSFLAQAPDAAWQVQPDGSGEFVYNTECHPLMITGAGGKKKMR